VLANRKAIRACTDLGDGGLALAAFEMAEGAGSGRWIDAADTGFLFGEDQARYLLAVPQEALAGLQAAAKAAGVHLALVGQFGGDQRDAGPGRGAHGRSVGGFIAAPSRRRLVCDGALMLRPPPPPTFPLSAA
jgi:hypothetical protein